MGEYDPILIGPLNLYNVTLAILTAGAIAIVVRLLVSDVRSGWRAPRGLRAVSAALGAGLGGLGIVVFIAMVFAESSHDLPAWGAFYLLPAAFLVGVLALGAVRPVHAGIVLLASAVLLVLLEAGLGLVARTIDPRWAEDEIDLGGVAVAFFYYAIPAGVSALLFLLAGLPAHLHRDAGGRTAIPA